VHGANRLGGNALAETQVFGRRAGQAAGSAGKREKTVDLMQIEQQQDRLDAFLSGTENPAEVRVKLQQAMWKGAGIFRTAAELRDTLKIVTHLSTANIRAASAQNLAECCILQNMCLTASLICRSALIREESRGAHVRKDVQQKYEAPASPYGHTFISQSREGVERKEAGA
jgi:fumarate reductase (CoM/CoB) subunit A